MSARDSDTPADSLATQEPAHENLPIDTIVPVIVRPVLVYPAKPKGKRKPPEAFLRAQWKKGQSGNPKGGHKKALTIKGMLEKIGDEMIAVGDRDGNIVQMTRREFVLRQAYLAAEAGDDSFVNFIAERIEGKVTQPIQQSVTHIEVGFENEDSPQTEGGDNGKAQSKKDVDPGVQPATGEGEAGT